MTIQDIQDTICAISTPPGVGGIAVIRITGPEAITITDKIWKGQPLSNTPGHTMRFGTITDKNGAHLDEAVAAVYRAPRSFTGQDTVEISVHGSIYVQQTLVETLIANGARLAAPGEFTRRAFAAGKMDLAQAEAVADVIASQSRAEHRIATTQMRGGYSSRLRDLRDKLIDIASLLELELDFSEEDVQFADRADLLERARELHREISRLENSFSTGSAIKNGIPVAIVGQTNVGKSSLLNAILGDDRAIVSDIHGTTRDIIEDTAPIGDYTFRFIDTAGIRNTEDTIERLGIERSRRAIAAAQIVILVLDPTTSDIDWDTARAAAIPQTSTDNTRIIIAINKSDIADTRVFRASQAIQDYITSITKGSEKTVEIIEISATTGTGIPVLKEAILRAAASGLDQSDIIVTNARHRQSLAAALPPLAAVIQALTSGASPYPISGDLIAQDLRAVIAALSTIIGDITTPDLLTTIFSRFCIGK